MQLSAVHDLVRKPGPFVTVQAEVGRTTEDARQQLHSRWTTIRHALEHEGVSADLVAEIGQRLHQRPPVAGPARRTLVAAGDEIVLDDVLAGETRWPEVIDVDLLPDLAPWVAQAERELPFCLVVADREGADIEFHSGLASAEMAKEMVKGEDFGITKVPQGDWKQKQYQRAVENTWKRTAGEIADAIRSGVRRRRPRVVLLAGDVREVTAVQDELQDLPVPVVKLSSGGRGAGSSEESLWAEVRRVLDEFEARDEEEVAQQLLARSGQGSGAARGLDEVLDAFVRGQVERLVVDLEAARGMTVDLAEHPGLGLPEDRKSVV